MKIKILTSLGDAKNLFNFLKAVQIGKVLQTELRFRLKEKGDSPKLSK